MLEQWRVSLGISEFWALRVCDLHPATERPTQRVRQDTGLLIDVTRTTAWRWGQRRHGSWPVGTRRHAGNHTHRHNLARNMLVDGIHINYPGRWPGHTGIQTAPVYLEFMPDPAGSLARVP